MKNLHVAIALNGKWVLRRAGSSRATKLFDTRAEAVAHGKVRAKRDGVVLCIHKRDGRIAQRFNVQQRREVLSSHSEGTVPRSRVREAVRKVLRDPRHSKKAKTARGEALAQRPVEQ